MGRIVGIDLGTTNSLVAYLDPRTGQPTCIPGPYDETLCPSVVSRDPDGGIVVGEPARRRLLTQPERTIYSVKRLMGRGPADVQDELKLFPFRIDPSSKNVIRVMLGEKVFTPPEISAFILRELKNWAETYFGETVDRAVITVPAYFNDNQRQATKDAGEIAGLQVVRIINEPTAASLAYGLDKAHKDLKIMVFDLSGGTLDVTIMEMGGGVFQVKSTSGDTQLGGTDMDNTLVEYVVQEFRKQSGLDVRSDKAAMMRIRDAAEKGKIELSNVVTTEINLPFLAYDQQSGPKNLIMQLTRSKLEELLKPIIDRCRQPMQQALQDAKITPADIEKIILIGGPTRMPMVRQFVASVMNKEPERGIDPMEAVAMGAAIQGAIIAGDVSTDILLVDVTPLTLGVEVLGGLREPLIER